jgi:hypothetical protein
MNTENLVVDDNTQGEEVKHIGEVVPDIGISVLSRALSVEPIGLGDAARLVVASDQMDAIGVS